MIDPRISLDHGRLDAFVPVIDLSLAPHSAAGRASLADSIGQACQESGFFLVVGHGVNSKLIKSAYDSTLAFFLLPEEEKDRAASSVGTQGFRRFGGYVAASSGIDTPPDLCQLFSMNRFGEPGVADGVQLGDQREALTTPNMWPSRPAELRDLWLSYYSAMEGLANTLMSLFSIALDLPDGFFDDTIDQHMTGLTANFYYPPTAPPLAGQYRKGPHSDWGSLTILYQDDAGGLQVKHPDSGWRDVPFLPGSFVINLGDLMAEWTAHRWVSTVHRVLPPPYPGNGRPRLSLAFFHQPNYDAVIEPLFGSPSEEQSRSEVITSGGWIARKMAAAYGPRDKA